MDPPVPDDVLEVDATPPVPDDDEDSPPAPDDELADPLELELVVLLLEVVVWAPLLLLDEPEALDVVAALLPHP